MTRPWQLFVDTGGTFTDALARSPEGRLRKAKVLSSGALRGSVKGQPEDNLLEVSLAWSAAADVLKGGTFRLLQGKGPPAKVVRFDPKRSLIELDRAPGGSLEKAIPPGAAFEVQTGEEAPILAARLLMDTTSGAPLPEISMRLGTTLATNALLTRTGAPTALFITQGFGDLLEIGTQQRPRLFDLKIVKPPPVHAAVVEVKERLAADGSVLHPLNTPSLESEARRLLDEGVTAAAVALLHGDRYPAHEQALAAFLQDAGFTHVSCSSEMARVIRIQPRAATTVVNAHLAPVVGGYLSRISAALAGGRLMVMTSAGGLVGTGTSAPKDLLLSGPAGGVVGAARAGSGSGFKKVISFDMGGTSTDVARFDGDYDYVFEHRVGDAALFAPALSIETVAAGGGSICAFDGTGLVVGPMSAGASPGPACYGAGGPLTLTDVNLLLGRLDPSRFEIPVDPGPAHTALDGMLDTLAVRNITGTAGHTAAQSTVRNDQGTAQHTAGHTGAPGADHTGQEVRAEAVLEGFLAIANERMADAIRRISIRRGYDPGEYSLVAFGGAGAQHACSVAARLGVKAVVVPADAGLLSARGMAGAVVERFAEEQLLEDLDGAKPRIPALLEELADLARNRLAEEGIPEEEAVVRRRIAEMRFAGQETTLQVEVGPDTDFEVAFADEYIRVYGHKPGQRKVELVSIRVVASSRPPEENAAAPDAPSYPAEPTGTQKAWFEDRWQEVPVYHREGMNPGACLEGPALVFERHSATVVEPGWRLEMDRAGSLVLRAVDTKCKSAADAKVMTASEARSKGATEVKGAGATDAKGKGAADTRPEAVQVELFSHRFEAIAREMGESLRRTAVSTNVKERLDFSCALLDGEGELVVNAPHIPVHLGSMGLCVRAVDKVLPLGEGDVAVTNHPDFGGSHLPDLTVVAPVHGEDGALLGHVAARAHHAEIGGTRPGSMPPSTKRLSEEGVVIPPTLAVEGGTACWDRIEALLTKPPWPTRALADNLADLNAAVAACHRGAEGLRALAAEHGKERVAHYMEALKDRAEHRMREALRALPDGDYNALEHLDDGTAIAVKIAIRGDGADVDFTGSSGVHPGNLNATPAIVRSAVIYVLRLLVQEDLPLNEGLMRPVSLILPEGFLNPPFPEDPDDAPSIVGGNVETSQRLVDTMIKALGLAAGSQGTMNNVLFGNDAFSYYETVCGGCGAGPGFAGAHAVHSHMTNTRITDPEVLEHRYPVRLERFSVRRGSGGKGRHPGGDGAVREMTFLESLELSILSQHRCEGPFGMAGGDPGARGAQRLVRAGGEVKELGAVDSCCVEPGDRLVLETPGGGGYGKA